MTAESFGWTIDAITLDLLRTVPAIAAQVHDNLDFSTEFMDELGAIEYDSGAISTIEIKAWTNWRIIHSIRFRDGSRLGDLRFRMADGRPMPDALLRSPCEAVLGHPIFSGYEWKTTPGDDNDALVSGVVNIPLGIQPGAALDAILSSTRTRHAA